VKPPRGKPWGFLAKESNGAYLFNRGFIMKPKAVKIVFYSFVMIEILVLALLGGSPDSNAATDNSHPSVDQILDRVENKSRKQVYEFRIFSSFYPEILSQSDGYHGSGFRQGLHQISRKDAMGV